MASLELTPNEASLLKEYLDRDLADLSYEISNTDSKDYRDNLKAQRDQLRAISERLGTLAVATG